MQGTVALLTQAFISPAPPRGISMSIYPFAFIKALALSREVSVTRFIAFSVIPADFKPFRKALTMAHAELNASLPPRSTHTLPLLRAKAAASLVTFGLLS